MTTYKEMKNVDGIVNAVQRSDGWIIPLHPDNTDYQAYLRWLEEGNTPLPAEENQ